MHPYFTPDAIARFWSKVDRSGGPDACWPWTACVQHKYGIFRLAYKNWKAHRVAYELAHGPLPDGSLACHTCDTPVCCNPAHLWAGTPADNSADMVRKGRSMKGVDTVPPERRARGDRSGARLHPDRLPRGENHGLRKNPELAARGEQIAASKLTVELVRSIRARYAAGESQQMIADSLHIHQATVSKVILRKTWGHVE